MLKFLFRFETYSTLKSDTLYEKPAPTVWTSENSKKLKNSEMLSQHHIFHSVLDFLEIDSSIYNENMSIFE
jgi:hypothetical protein